MKEIDIVVSDEVAGRFPLSVDKVQAYAARIMIDSDFDQYTLNIVFIGDHHMAEMNESYRKRSGTTDVLSFTLSDKTSEILEGEVYISLDRAEIQAVDWGVLFEEEIIRLVTHGLLHLCGRTHDTEEDYRTIMEDTERYMRRYYENEERT